MTQRTIAKPDPKREPMKVNVYRFVQNCPTALAPLFPYLDEGSIVPCAASFRGGPGKGLGRFQHFNTVDELGLVWGASGKPGRGVGMVYVGAKLHMVQPLNPADDPDDSVVVVITQRQKIGEPQREEMRFVCEKCDRRLLMVEIDATPPKRGTGFSGAPLRFETIAMSYEAAKKFNADEAARTCGHCGHVNPPFPLDNWAWGVHVEQSELARKSAASMASAKPIPPQAQGG
jgi:hypothetical protein